MNWIVGTKYRVLGGGVVTIVQAEPLQAETMEGIRFSYSAEGICEEKPSQDLMELVRMSNMPGSCG